ncbi:MAG TPA: choice-of-anchor L domain-containing protein [Bacteroidia bacterium]|nr:choice-of-anchor L domain-containing protein [Bacteroidia bacterium]
MNKNLFFKIAILLLPVSLFAQPSQLQVTVNNTATQLAQNITGGGVTVTNASINCGGIASGTFTYPSTGTNLGLTSGILLTTGKAVNAANRGGILCSFQNGNDYRDPDLTHIDTTAHYDVCILQFDFVPICNQVSITYVFGSEEYPKYIGQFNDVFGIFLTGTNPSGPVYNGTNIANLPTTTTSVSVVSIDNVNNGFVGGNVGGFPYPPQPASNPQYFHVNYGPPASAVNRDIAYDGYTIPITSVAPVVPCSTYHMKIAIADAGDEEYDSGVFIGGNAVNCSTAPTASIASTPASSCGGNDGTASVTVSNYTGTPTYSWSQGGQTTASISNLAPGAYTCLVSFATGCSGVYTQTLTTNVNTTVSNLNISASSSPSKCGGPTGSATVSVSGGTAPYNIAWSTSPVQTSTVVSSLMPGTYSVGVHDNAGCFQTTTVNINVTNPVNFNDTSVQVCGNNVLLQSPSGSAYQWYDVSNTIIPGATSQSYSVNSAANGQHYIVSYKDNTTGCRDSLKVNISEYAVNYNVNALPACTGGNTGAISVSTTGTYTFATYDWAITGAATNSATAVPSPFSINNLPAGTYSIVITQAGNPSCASVYTRTVTLTTQASVTNTITACGLDTLQLNPSIPAGYTNNWYAGSTFLGSTTANTSYSVIPTPLQVNGTIYTDVVKSPAGCVDTIKLRVQVQSFTAIQSIIQQPLCYNDNNAEVMISVPRETNGPIGKPYTFTWIYPSPYTSPAPVNGGSFPASSTKPNLNSGTASSITYSYVVNAGNCVQKGTFTLSNPAKLQTDSIFAYYCPKDSLALLIADTGRTNYVWHPNNSVASFTGDSAHVPVPSLSSYYVTYLNNGCPDTGKIIISVNTYNAFRPDETVNVFSPNGDKTNDYFYPFYSQHLNQYQIFKQSDSYELNVYDRWGKHIYQTTDYSKPWDGKTKSGHEADNGTYFFVVKYKSNCGSRADVVEKKGFVELVR